jgi:hypothetical protein
MDAMNASRVKCKDDAETLRASWPAEVENLAFQFWAFTENQNCAEVAKRLAEGKLSADEEGQPVGYAVPLRTIQHWAKTNDWAKRREDFFRDNGAGILHRVWGNLMLAAIEGSQYVHDVNAGKVAQPDKVRLDSAKFSVDRVGFSPTGNREPGRAVSSEGSSRQQALDQASLSDDELDALERNLYHRADPDRRR